jgi:hypothetical protein
LVHPDYVAKYSGINKDLAKCIDIYYYKGNKTEASYLFAPIFKEKVAEIV